MISHQQLQSVKRRYGIIGRSEALDNALHTALRVAGTDLSVLISGESGVGKEVFSRLIHDNSSRKHEGFIAVNAGAIPSGTINSELFGHEKGSFTGATGERKGYFETYDGGTIFLDEIGEMPPETQSFLLRVLETGEFIRVGGNKTLRTDVRIIAATNVDLLEKIKEGKFREDLYYRLNTVSINLPPLRERQEDIHLLFRKFAADFAERYRTEPVRLDDSAQAVLEHYSWPGNIRELKNVAEQLSVLTDERQVDAEQLQRFMPQLFRRHLPAISDHYNSGPAGDGTPQEREIMFKFLLDMKSDLNDLKRLIFDLISKNDLQIPDQTYGSAVKSLELPRRLEANVPDLGHYEDEPSLAASDNRNSRPILVDEEMQRTYDESEIVEENLSLAANERDLIIKALRKHGGRRREAAEDLGISERTLYRKIKEYELNE
jgi:DNA-binding NtrC family response regulator